MTVSFQSLLASEGSTPRKPIAVVLHQEKSSPGRIGHVLRHLGYRLEEFRPRFGDVLPEAFEEYSGAIIFGGPMSANDDESYIHAERAWIDLVLRHDVPFLGVCLGAQLLVQLLGGRVLSHPEGKVEVGYYPIRPTLLGESLVSRWPSHVYQWHLEGLGSGVSGIDLLACGDEFENQAFRYGRSAFGLQFHCEVTYAMKLRWTTRGYQRFALPGAQGRDAHICGHFLYEGGTIAWMKAFLKRWLESDTRA